MSESITRWMISDTIGDGRIEHGPFSSGLDAEVLARRAGCPFLLKYDIQLGHDGHVDDARVLVIELPGVGSKDKPALYTKCQQCGEGECHLKTGDAEMWADIHEFEHLQHKVRYFIRDRNGLQEMMLWRGAMPAPRE